MKQSDKDNADGDLYKLHVRDTFEKQIFTTMDNLEKLLDVWQAKI
jgi:hypothetical protein